MIFASAKLLTKKVQSLENEVSDLRRTVAELEGYRALASEVENLKNDLSELRNLTTDMREYEMGAASAYAQWRFAGRGGKYLLNCVKPKTLNEKIIWIRENFWARSPVSYYLTDKYLFKHFIDRLYGSEHLPKLLGVYNTADAIDFDALPEKFVLKRTLSGGSTEVLIVDKDSANLEELRRTARRWMAPGRIPARIIAEERLEPDADGCITDYKFYCARGKILFVKVLKMNVTGEKKTRYMSCFNSSLEPLPIYGTKPKIKDEIAKPKAWDDMLDFARKVSMMFPFIRADLYAVGDTYYVGELTDTPMEGLDPIDQKSDVKYGRLLKLPTDDEIAEYNRAFVEKFRETVDCEFYLRSNLSVYNIYHKGKLVKKNSELPVPKGFMKPSDSQKKRISTNESDLSATNIKENGIKRPTATNKAKRNE